MNLLLVHSVFQSGYANLHSHQRHTKVLFVCMFTNSVCRFLMMAILSGVKRCLILFLICLSLMISGIEYLFICLLATYISPWKNIFRSPVHFQSGWNFLRLSCMSCLYILNFNCFVGHIIYKYFLPFSRLCLSFVDGFLCYTKVLCLISSYLFIFAFVFLYCKTQIPKNASMICDKNVLCFLLWILWLISFKS